ncbi:MAG TPA: SMI1/KNR4 family protein, partial [Armatimonadota bacterium]|nr:SMI1/KNR4 family protein [Armatimonadota bacterium]
QAHERYKGRIPRGLIPIADDSGNQICLAIFGSETGKVFYWDHHDEDDGVDEQSPASLTEGLPRNLYLVARSFEEFLMGLTIMEW